METTTFLSVVLPLMVVVIIFGLGLTLTLEDFYRIKNSPKPVFVGLFIQMVICPIFAFFLAKWLPLSPEMSIGFMLLAASPGGTSSNLFSLLAKGEIALNVSLTAINSVLSIGFIPLMIFIAFSQFGNTDVQIPVPLLQVGQTISAILIPLAIGMWIRKKNAQFAIRSEVWVRKLSVFLLVTLTVLGLAKEWRALVESGVVIFSGVMLFCVGNALLAFFVSRFFKQNRQQAISITFEVCVHNAVMAMAIAGSPQLLNNLEMAIPSALYGPLSLVVASIIARMFLANRI